MLILSRKLGESIMIGEDISVTVLGVTGNQIRIGVDAPKNISVHREEIYQRISESPKTHRKRQNSNHLRTRAKLSTQTYS